MCPVSNAIYIKELSWRRVMRDDTPSSMTLTVSDRNLARNPKKIEISRAKVVTRINYVAKL